MIRSLSSQDNELYQRLDEVLHYLWDPIGVVGAAGARSEYTSYTPTVFRVVKEATDAHEVAQHLTSLQSNRMGVAVDPRRALEIAELMIEHRDRIADRYANLEGTRPLKAAVILKRFETPDEIRSMEKGRFEIVHIGGLIIGRATYEPGWRWSEHVGPSVGARLCTVEHVGLVVSGTASAALEGGRVFELSAGNLFHVPAVPHDSWVVGSEPYVSIHLLGAAKYAT